MDLLNVSEIMPDITSISAEAYATGYHGGADDLGTTPTI